MAVETARIRARAVAIPAWAWVSGIVLVSALFYFALGRRIVAPWILTDELVYSEAAKSFAATGHMLIRGHGGQNPGLVYPALISPAWGLFSKIPDAYAAAKAVNALMISLAAVPAYLLGRRVLSQPLALVGAALSVAVPSMLYSGTIMTENAFYPLFLGCAYALVLVLERPTFPRSIVLIVLLGAAFLTRAQGVFLLPAILTAPVLLLVLRRRNLRELVPYWRLYTLAAVAVLAPVLVQLVRGRAVSDLFGRYGTVSNATYPIGSVAKWFVYHVAELDLYVGIVPFAAVILLVALFRRLEPGHQVFAAAALALSFWLVLVVAAVDQTYHFVYRVAERNMFYAAPLFLIGMLVWIERGLPRPRRWAVGAAAAAAALPLVLPLQWMLNINIVSDTLGLIPWWRLEDALGSSGWTRAILALYCVAAGVAFLFWPARLRFGLPVLVLASLLTVMGLAEGEWHNTSRSLFDVMGSPRPDWIDRALPAGARAAVVNSGHVPPVVIWEYEFFNRAAGDVYYLADPTPGGLPEWRTRIASDGILHARSLGRVRYALSDGTAVPQGTEVAAGGPFAVYRVSGPLRMQTYYHGLYPGEAWSGKTLTYARYGCTGGTVGVTMASAPSLFHSTKTVTVETGGPTRRISVPPSGPVNMRLPLVPRDGTCRIVLTVTPAPLRALATGTAPRPYGLQFAFSP